MIACRSLRRAALALAALALVPARAEDFSAATTPSLTAAKVQGMSCRYFTELLGVTNAAGIARQFDPAARPELDTIVCCPMSWRFYNFPSAVDRTWREPDKHPRNLALFPPWRRMVDNLQAGGDPLRDALVKARAMRKRFIVSFRMNDSHYIQNEEFPTHNNFWRDHPEWRLGNDPAAPAQGDASRLFNYMVPQVRDFYFAVLEEICMKYDVDGIELDLQRAPRLFHDRDVEAGRAVLTAHIGRIRQMLERVGTARGRPLRLGVRVLHTVEANRQMGADVRAWDAAGWLDDIIVSSSYIHSADTGIEGFVAAPRKAAVYGELNFVHLQLPGTGHNSNERRYVTAPTYRAATLSYLERGADGVSFFNTYCIPQPALDELLSGLLPGFKDRAALRRADKAYTTYAAPGTMFGRIFPAKDEKRFTVFIADPVPGLCRTAALRLETKAPCDALHIEASLNGVALQPERPREAELVPPLTVNAATPRRENVVFFAVPLTALKFGANFVAIRNADALRRHCDFTSAELALRMQP